MNTQRVAAGVIFLGVVSLFALTVVVTLAGGPAPLWEGLAFGAWLFAFALVGLLIVFRRPGNAIAWLCLGFALAWGFQIAFETILGYETLHPGSVPWPEYLAVFADQMWVFGVGLLGFVLLLFPEGSLPSRRWKPLAGVLLATMILIVAYGVTRPGPFPDRDLINPLGVEWVGRVEVAAYALLVVLVTTILVSASSLVVRFRRSDEAGRRQLKWLMAAGIVSAISYALLFVNDRVPWILAWTTIPVAIGFAVLRYRLYDIDRLVSRTITYAVVAGLLAAVYFGAVVVFSTLLPAESDMAVAGSTLLLAVLFNPVRRRVKDMVDKRFDRTRFDHGRVIERFTRDVNKRTDLGEIQTSLADVIGSTLRTTSLAVWVRSEDDS